MVSIPRFFRKESDDFGIDLHAASAPTEPIPLLRPTITNVHQKPVDPVRKAVFSRIGLVSVEDSSQLPALLTEDSMRPKIVQRFHLPRNPRIAGDELYELDGMDMIVFATEKEKDISKDTIRWIKLLKQLGIPMLVLLPFAPIRRREREKVTQFSQYIGLPVVTIQPDNLDEARQEFVVTTMRIAPAMGLALAAHMPYFRSPLVGNLVEMAVEDTLNSRDIAAIQTQLLHQICAAYGRNGQQFEQHKVALETLMATTLHYTTRFVARLPMKDTQRRLRFTHALSTLFLGYAVTIYLGETPPSIRKNVLPEMWRLYRAAGKPILK